jgi:hypothetical protein
LNVRIILPRETHTVYEKGNQIDIKISKATVRSIMTYALETRSKTPKNRQMLEANEMKVPRKTIGYTKIECLFTLP